MGELDGRLIILTGGAGGIARETAPLLLAQGAELLLIDVDRGRLDEARRALEATGRVEVAISRLESPAACEAALAGIARPVYALVHLAGVFEPDALDAASRPIWDRTLAVNLTNAFDIAAAVQPRLDAHEVCRMLFVSSLAFRRGSFDHIAYTAAKGGIVGLVRALARRLAPGVLVNGLAPGIILTGMPDHMLVDERRERALRAETMLKRFGHPREVASVIAFLLATWAARPTPCSSAGPVVAAGHGRRQRAAVQPRLRRRRARPARHPEPARHQADRALRPRRPRGVAACLHA